MVAGGVADYDEGAAAAGWLSMLCKASRDGDEDLVQLTLATASQHRPDSGGNLDAACLLDDEDADEFVDEPVLCPLHYAAQHGHVSIVRRLLAAGASTEVRSSSLFASTPPPLMLAAAGGHASVVEALVDAGAATQFAEPPLFRTALHVAVCNGHTGTVAALLAGGASWSARDRDGTTAYALALRRYESLAPERDAWELERALVALGHRAPVSHEARMSGVDAGGNWAASGDGLLEMRKLASRARARMTSCVEAVEAPVRGLTLAMQRLHWALGLTSAQSRSGCFCLSPDLVEATGLLVLLPVVPGTPILSRLWRGHSREKPRPG
jgi:hypothetical protein